MDWWLVDSFVARAEIVVLRGEITIVRALFELVGRLILLSCYELDSSDGRKMVLLSRCKVLGD